MRVCWSQQQCSTHTRSCSYPVLYNPPLGCHLTDCLSVPTSCRRDAYTGQFRILSAISHS
jgi:hypothetical protein